MGPGGGSLGTRACVRPRGAGETRLGTAVRGPGTATRTSGDKALPDRRERDGGGGGRGRSEPPVRERAAGRPGGASTAPGKQEVIASEGWGLSKCSAKNR